MKKLLLLTTITGLLYSNVTIKRANDNKDQIRVNGYVLNVYKYFDYDVIEIKLKNGKRIKAKETRQNLYKDNDIVFGTCVNFQYDKYERCSLYKR